MMGDQEDDPKLAGVGLIIIHVVRHEREGGRRLDSFVTPPWVLICFHLHLHA